MMMRSLVVAALGLVLAVSPAIAQQPSPAEAFASEWLGLDSSISAIMVQRRSVAKDAQALIDDWILQGKELGYWRRWFEGEKAAWLK